MGNVIISETQDLKACHWLRTTVFVDEQQVDAALEFDGLDDQAIHLIARDADEPVGTARIFIQETIGKIGRVCVLKQRRGEGIGRDIMLFAIKRLSADQAITMVKISAQTAVLGFYEGLGFVAHGDEYMERGHPPSRYDALSGALGRAGEKCPHVSKHRLEHVCRQAAGIRVVATAMITIKKGIAANVMPGSMGEFIVSQPSSQRLDR